MYLENFKKYWKEQLIHTMVGLIAGILAIVGHGWAALILIGTVWTRQSLEYLKRDDTPGIDLAYHIIGILTGIVIGLIVIWFLY